LEKLIDQPHIRPWFDPLDELWIERDILLPSGAILRPDRVMRKGDNLVVLDYKTGQANATHTIQVQQYATHLRQMYPGLQISGYLWYLETNKWLAV
jgi:ATP-dependent helicase/nuclease subunit A